MKEGKCRRFPKRALRHLPWMPTQRPLRKEIKRWDDADDGDASPQWEARWNAVDRPTTSDGTDATAIRPPLIKERKKPPSWIKSRILTAGQKCNAFRCFLYSFPLNRRVRREQAEECSVQRTWTNQGWKYGI